MSGEMERLRNDLDVIQEAIGVKLPFSWKDVRLNLLLAAAGILTAVLARVVRDDMLRWSLIPIIFAAIPMLTTARKRSTDDSLQAARRREYRLSWLACLIVMVVVVPYLLWERRLGALTLMTAGGATVLSAGIICSVLSLTSPGRRHYWGQAIPLIFWGLLIPVQSPRQISFGGGITCFFCGFFAAAIQAWQLWRQERA